MKTSHGIGTAHNVAVAGIFKGFIKQVFFILPMLESSLYNYISTCVDHVKKYLLISTQEDDIKITMSLERKTYNTTLKTDLIKKLKILSAEMDKRQNDLLEEAIEDLIEKYSRQPQEKK